MYLNTVYEYVVVYCAVGGSKVQLLHSGFSMFAQPTTDMYLADLVKIMTINKLYLYISLCLFVLF